MAGGGCLGLPKVWPALILGPQFQEPVSGMRVVQRIRNVSWSLEGFWHLSPTSDPRGAPSHPTILLQRRIQAEHCSGFREPQAEAASGFSEPKRIEMLMCLFGVWHTVRAQESEPPYIHLPGTVSAYDSPSFIFKSFRDNLGLVEAEMRKPRG